MPTINKTLSQRIVMRLNLIAPRKGLKRDKLALELVIGAGIALEAIDHTDASNITLVAQMVAVRGASFLEDLAKLSPKDKAS